MLCLVAVSLRPSMALISSTGMPSTCRNRNAVRSNGAQPGQGFMDDLPHLPTECHPVRAWVWRGQSGRQTICLPGAGAEFGRLRRTRRRSSEQLTAMR